MFSSVLRPQQQVSTGLPIQAPTGGLNDFDPLAAMDSRYMIDCLNMIPGTSMVDCRPGYVEVVPSIGHAVKSLLSYAGTSGSSILFAATDDGIYDMSGAKVFAGITNGDMGHLNFTNQSNSYMVAWNGVDPAVLFNGTSWIAFDEVATPVSPGQISGLDPSDISFACVHVNRLFFVEKNSMTVFFLPLDAVAGIASPLYMGSNFNKGGRVLSLHRWSSDTGRGLDDRFVVITTQGEAASFTGTDPANADNWSLDSVFSMAAPLGEKAIDQFGGDVIFLSRRGLVPLSTMMYGTTSDVAYAGTLSKYINNTIAVMTAEWSSLPYVPEVRVHYEAQWITVSIFDRSSNQPTQLVMNILTGAWGRTSYPARCMLSSGGQLYMGTDSGRVLMVTPSQYTDEEEDGTLTPITYKCTSAYTYLERPTANKHANLIRIVLKSQSPPSYLVRVLPDFRTDDWDPYVSPALPFSAAVWDVALWDQARWPTKFDIWMRWDSANVLGYAFCWQIKGSTSVALGITAAEWVSAPGGLV